MNGDVRGTPTLLGSAPGLFYALRRAFTPETVTQLDTIYSEVIRSGGWETPSVPREAGVSYNPHPARIGRILLTEGDASAELLGVTLGVLVPRGKLPDSPLAPPELVERVRGVLRDENARRTEDDEGIVLAFLLDEIRHLHMSNLSDAQRGEVVTRGRRTVAAIHHTERWGRIVLLVQHALARWE